MAKYVSVPDISISMYYYAYILQIKGRYQVPRPNQFFGAVLALKLRTITIGSLPFTATIRPFFLSLLRQKYIRSIRLIDALNFPGHCTALQIYRASPLPNPISINGRWKRKEKIA
jgi:hypothetical protein